MSSQIPTVDSHLSFALNSLRVALHVQPDFSGMATALHVASHCLEQAAEHYNDDHLIEWRSASSAVSSALNNQAELNTAAAATWYQPSQTGEGPLRRLSTWRSSLRPDLIEQQLDILIGRAIAVAASSNSSIAPALLDGAHVLKNAKSGKGKRSPDWDLLNSVDLLDPARLSLLYESAGHKVACASFITAAIAVLRSPISTPYRHVRDEVQHATSEPSRNSADASTPDEAVKFELPKPENDSMRREDLYPDIGARMSSSNYTSFSEKLGFVTRDYIAPDDLALITRQLFKHFHGNDQRRSTLALFALISLLTGCSDFIALKLRFAPQDSIWLDTSVGAWCWAFSAYRDSVSPDATPAIGEPIYIALPHEVAVRLSELRVSHQSATSLGDLIGAELGAPFPLEEFREFLRTCGDSAHPPYASRFAKSMMFVYLKTSGSDMTAAMLSGHFAVAAPAALFYYGPSYKVLHQRLHAAYSFLGLGEPVDIKLTGERAACQKVLEVHQLQDGWNQLIAEIRHLHTQITSALTMKERIADINQLMVLLCAAFVIQTAHRGTRIERLTFGAMFMVDNAALIADKDDDDRSQPRLIPKTGIVKWLLAMAAELHCLIKPELVDGIAHDTSLFVNWVDGSHPQKEPVTTGDIAKVIADVFEGSDFNFARSAWVTHLDEDGCDRWLIRVLTGHTRDVTRTNGAYFDIPPLKAADRLGLAMEKTGRLMFGNTVPTDIHHAPVVLFRASGRQLARPEVSFMVPDPRTLLDPLSETMLAGWRAINHLRFVLTEGSLQAPPSVLAALHMLAFDFIPEIELCMDALVCPRDVIHCHGKTAGLLWKRPHFTQPTWLPLLPTTARLIVLADADQASEAKLMHSIAGALHSCNPGYWPAKPDNCIAALLSAARAFLRLTIPPSLLAVSDPVVPAPALNDISLMRLANESIDTSMPIATRMPSLPVRKAKHSQSDEDLKTLRKIINDNASQTERLGELRKRALDCLRRIGSEVRSETTFCIWAVEWVTSELQESAENTKGRLDISSINTYLGVISRGSRLLGDVDTEDPYEWSEDVWQNWLDALNNNISLNGLTKPSEASASVFADPPVTLHKRIKDAVGRLVRNLIKRGQWVPTSIRSVLAEKDEKLPTGSASSILVTGDDIERAIQIATGWLSDQPLDALMLELRARIQACVPTRSSEVSNLRLDCMTQNGQLVIDRVGYKNIKNDNSVRTIQAPDDLQKLIRVFIAELIEYQPDAAFLLRGKGNPEDGRRDVNLISVLSAALKFATCDPDARPHSSRSTSLQNIAWPGWVEQARQLLHARASPDSCTTWIADHADWNRAAYASHMAGHGDLRAAFGNYMSGWSLVFGMHALASLKIHEARPKFLQQLGIDPAGLRKYRQRASGESNEWQWVFGRVAEESSATLRKMLHPFGAIASSAASQPALPPPTEVISPTAKETGLITKPVGATKLAISIKEISPGDLDDVRYLTARILGMSKAQAIERCQVSLSRASFLDADHAPPDQLALMATSRARDAAHQRGRQGNQNVLFADQGTEVLKWVMSLTGRQRLTLASFIYKLRITSLSDPDMAIFWTSLVSGLPDFSTLHVHRGQSHLHDREHSALLLDGAAIALKVDAEIGAVPGIRLAMRGVDNRVLSTRLNSVFCAAVLACVCITGGLQLDY